MRRTLIIIASIIFLLGIGVAVYYFFIAPNEATLDVTDGVSFGSSDDVPLGAGETPGEMGPVPAGEEVAPRLIRITDSYVATGAVAIALPSKALPATSSTSPAQILPGDTEIRYIDRASGNVYAYRFHERTLERISNRTIPGIQEASWLSDGSLAFARFLPSDSSDGRISTYALPANGDGGYTLEQGLQQVLVSGTSTVFTLLSGANGSVGTAARPDGTNSRTVFSSTLANITAHLSNGPYMVHTKASSQLDGYGFTVSSTGALTRVVGPFRGLSILPSPSGKLVLFSYVQDRTLRLSVLDLDTNTATALPLATLTEKCAWTPDSRAIYCGIPRTYVGTLPDDWYQGAVSFTDRLWRIDMQGRFATLVVDPLSAGDASIDMIGLTLDGNADVLTFKNKADGSLWAYDI